MNRYCIRRAAVLAGVLLSLNLLTGCVGKGGTTIMLRTNELAPPSRMAHGSIALLDQADDSYPSSPAIGEATWTLFRMHLAGIKAEPSPKTEIVTLAKNSFMKAGYEVRLVQATQAMPSQDPFVHVRIDEFSYEMWSWTWPYVPIFGSTAITLSVRTPDGRQTNARLFRASGKESCWFGDCEKQVEAAVAQSLTSIMNQVTQWASEDSFRSAALSSRSQHARP
jgi:hypothetical protein